MWNLGADAAARLWLQNPSVIGAPRMETAQVESAGDMACQTSSYTARRVPAMTALSAKTPLYLIPKFSAAQTRGVIL